MMIPMTDRGFTFGDGVYDATMARNQKIFALDEHGNDFGEYGCSADNA